MRRRERTAFVASTAAWPLAARVQQPVVGSLDLAAESKNPHAFNRGSADTAHVAGRSVALELRSTDGQCDRFPELVPDLVRRNVAVIATSRMPAAPAAKAAAPVEFLTAAGPVKIGLVASLTEPGGNVVPPATRVAVLVNPADAACAQSTVIQLQ